MGDICSNKESKINKKELIKKIEQDAYNKLQNLNKNNIVLCEELKNIMADGANEFKEKTGRNMNYAEMRQAYG